MAYDGVKSTEQRVDEVGLVDLWLVLVRYRLVLLGVFLACCIAGLAIALIKPIQYTYSVAVEIGRKLEGDVSKPIELLETVVAKLQENYVPSVVRGYAESHPDDAHFYRLRVRAPKNSELVVVEAVGAATEQPTYLGLLGEVVKLLVRDHARITAIIRSNVELRLSQAKLKLEDLREQGGLLTSRLKRVDEEEQLLSKQRDDLDKQIKTSLDSRKQAVTEAADQPRAMTVLLIDSELEKNRTRLSDIEKNLYITIKNEREGLQKTLGDNRRDQEQQAQQIAALELEKSSVLETRALDNPAPSLLPTGMGRSVIVALAAVGGLVAGLFVVFFLAFMEKVHQVQGKVAKRVG